MRKKAELSTKTIETLVAIAILIAIFVIVFMILKGKLDTLFKLR